MNNNIVTHLIIVTYYLEFIYMNEQPHAHSQAPMRAKYMMVDITAPDNTMVIVRTSGPILYIYKTMG